MKYLEFGVLAFISQKELNDFKTVKAYIKKLGLQIDPNSKKAANIINKNFVSFASFCDKSIKEGTLEGKAVKLNTYYDERREYKQQAYKEYKEANLTAEHEFLLSVIKKDLGCSKLSSFLAKNGIEHVEMDKSKAARRLQYLPIINLVIENGIDNFKAHVKVRYNIDL